jgi:hypothetical protein
MGRHHLTFSSAVNASLFKKKTLPESSSLCTPDFFADDLARNGTFLNEVVLPPQGNRDLAQAFARRILKTMVTGGRRK